MFQSVAPPPLHRSRIRRDELMCVHLYVYVCVRVHVQQWSKESQQGCSLPLITSPFPLAFDFQSDMRKIEAKWNGLPGGITDTLLGTLGTKCCGAPCVYGCVCGR